MNIKKWLKIFISLLVIGSNLGCDQITKEKVRVEIAENEVIRIVGDHFILTKVENTGAALSLGANLPPVLKTIILQIFPFIVLCFLFGYIVKESSISRLNVIGLSFIIGGGIGNIYDRILHNSVTDFMYLELGSLRTGIFNMADVSVIVGMGFILLNLAVQNTVYKTFD